MDPITRRMPVWTLDELILACDLVERNGWREVRATDPRAIELSQVLRDYWAAHSNDERDSSFRSPNSVQLKSSNIVTARKDYQLKPTRGNKLDHMVLDLFSADPVEMRNRAVAIRQIIAGLKSSGERAATPADIDEDGVAEGGLLERTRLILERDRSIRDKAVNAFRQKHERVRCEACSFDFGATYGPRGEDYIECHHRVPLSQSGPTTTHVEDLVLLCSNCHRMIHRTRPWLTFEELVALIAR